ncbi:hypothetical protein AB0N62_37310 [Streptomyces sp. NPDC093982]|uniref:hypothetical protein n=1 Tax=Streptomyces sp. NPDC093982 TaxID=3155077 RepID=UPI00343FEB0E
MFLALPDFAEAPEADCQWGTVTARQWLVHRLEVVSRMTVSGGGLQHLGQPARAMRNVMLTRWPTLRPVPSRLL